MFREYDKAVQAAAFTPQPAFTRGVAPEACRQNAYSEARLLIRQRDSWLPILVADILLLRADGDYVEVHTARQQLLYTSTLTKLLVRLAPAPFQRISRSEAVNLLHVTAVRPVCRQLMLRLSNGQEVSSSRRGASALRATLLAHPKRPEEMTEQA